MTYDWPTEVDPVNDLFARELASNSSIAIPVLAYKACGMRHRVAASVMGAVVEVIAHNAFVREVKSNGHTVGFVEL